MLKLKKIIIIFLIFLLAVPFLTACKKPPAPQPPAVELTDGLEGIFAGKVDYVDINVALTFNGDGTGHFIFGEIVDGDVTYEIDEDNTYITVTLKEDTEKWEGSGEFTAWATGEDELRLSYLGIIAVLSRKDESFTLPAASDAGAYAGLNGTFMGYFYLPTKKEAYLVLDGKGFSRMKFGSQDWRNSIYGIKPDGKGGYEIAVLEENENDKITGAINSADEIKAKYSGISITFKRQ